MFMPGSIHRAQMAFRAGELNDDRVADVLKALPGILPAEKK